MEPMNGVWCVCPPLHTYIHTYTQLVNGTDEWRVVRLSATPYQGPYGESFQLVFTKAAAALGAGGAVEATNEFKYTETVEEFVVPQDGLYRLTACGAKAADGSG